MGVSFASPVGLGSGLGGLPRITRETECVRMPKHIPTVPEFAKWKVNLFSAVVTTSGRGEGRLDMD